MVSARTSATRIQSESQGIASLMVMEEVVFPLSVVESVLGSGMIP